VALTTGNLLYKNIKAAGLRHLETFDILITFFHFLMIQPKLAIRIITPNKDLSKVKENKGLISLLAGGWAWFH
jgi:hypothetical protein